MARPIGTTVYKEPRKAITIYVDKALSDKIDETARKNKVSRVEYINALIVQADEERAVLLAKSYDDLKRAVHAMTEVNAAVTESNNNCVKKLNRMIGGNIAESIYCSIEPDEIAKEAFNRVRDKFMAVKAKTPVLTPRQTDFWVGLTFEEMEKVGFERGKIIRNRTLAEKMLKKLLVEGNSRTVAVEV